MFLRKNRFRKVSKMKEGLLITDHLQMPQRASESHKGDYGKVGIIAGSRGMAGAGELCTKACLRAGAGLVTVAAADCLTEVYEFKFTEAMVYPLADTEGHISAEALPSILSFIGEKDCVAFGPGLGRSHDIVTVLEGILDTYSGNLVIDADGLFALSKCREKLLETRADVLITPHMGEMSRLTGTSIPEMKADRTAAALRFAHEYGVTVLLKDNVSAIASPDGRVKLNTAGNPGMARGGSGDVLAGVCAAFFCRFGDPFSAACEAALTCGIAGDLAAWKYGMESMLPSDTISFIGQALMEPASNHVKQPV